MKSLFTICLIFQLSFISYNTAKCQATYWESLIMSDYFVENYSNHKAIGPLSNNVTDRFGNIIIAQYVSTGYCTGCSELQIIKYSSSGDFINNASYALENQDIVSPQLATDRSGNIYVYLTLISNPFGDPTNVALIKYNTNVIFQWETFYPWAMEGNNYVAFDLLVNNNSPGVEIYITGQEYSPSDGATTNFIARYNTAGTLININWFDEPIDEYESEMKMVQHRNGNIYAVANTPSENSIRIVRIPPGSPAYLTNISDAVEFTIGSISLSAFTKMEIDRDENIYIHESS